MNDGVPFLIALILAAAIVIGDLIFSGPPQDHVSFRFNLPHCHFLEDRSVVCTLKKLKPLKEER